MEFEPNVSINAIKPEMLLGLMVVQEVYRLRSARLRVTSVSDGQHTARGSYHNNGYAVDLGTKGTGLAFQLWDDLQKRLGPLGFDVVLEDQGGPNEHIHVEYDVVRA